MKAVRRVSDGIMTRQAGEKAVSLSTRAASSVHSRSSSRSNSPLIWRFSAYNRRMLRPMCAVLLLSFLALHIGCSGQQKPCLPPPPPKPCECPAAAAAPKKIEKPFEELTAILTEAVAIVGAKGERCAKSAGELRAFMDKRQRRLTEILNWYNGMSEKKLSTTHKKELGKRFEASARRFMRVHTDAVPVLVRCGKNNKELRATLDPLTTALLRFINQTPMNTGERRFFQLCELVEGDGMCPRDGKPADPFKLWMGRLRDPKWAFKAIRELVKLGDIRAVQPLCDLYQDFPSPNILKALRSFETKTKVPCLPKK
jgi:hypothetical protein